jgi:hypothetical protein
MIYTVRRWTRFLKQQLPIIVYRLPTQKDKLSMNVSFYSKQTEGSHLLFVDKETNGSYPFASGLNGLTRLWTQIYVYIFSLSSLNEKNCLTKVSEHFFQVTSSSYENLDIPTNC